MMCLGFLAVGVVLLAMAAVEWRSGRALVARIWGEPFYVTAEESLAGFRFAVGSKAGSGVVLTLLAVLSLITA